MIYLYAISHLNLPTHQQAIQSAHAQLEYVRQNGVPEEHPTYIWLTVASKLDLLLLSTMLESKGVKVCEFTDPDFPGYDPSAIACVLTEEQRGLLSDLSLWKCSPNKEKSNFLFKFIRKALKGKPLTHEEAFVPQWKRLLQVNKGDGATTVN